MSRKRATAIEVKHRFKELRNEIKQAESKVMGWRIAFIRGDDEAEARWIAWKDELKVRQKALRTFTVKHLGQLTSPKDEE